MQIMMMDWEWLSLLVSYLYNPPNTVLNTLEGLWLIEKLLKNFFPDIMKLSFLIMLPVFETRTCAFLDLYTHTISFLRSVNNSLIFLVCLFLSSKVNKRCCTSSAFLLYQFLFFCWWISSLLLLSQYTPAVSLLCLPIIFLLASFLFFLASEYSFSELEDHISFF